MQSPFEKTLIVTPAFNEHRSVGDVVREVQRTLPGVTCLVVDDGSTDHTAEVAREAGAIVAELPYNMGVGGAMRTGFRFAKENGFQYVVQVDADGQHDPSEVPALIAALSEADIVIGARFAGKGDYDVRGPRKWAMVVLAKALSRTASADLTDTTSGFRASGPRAISLFAENYPAEYLGDTIESLVIAARAGCRITQVPAAMRLRAAGQPSTNPVKSTVFLARVAMAVAFAFMRRRVLLIEETA
jgi:glycosyltransferase involved in cell wall biosynthesis